MFLSVENQKLKQVEYLKNNWKLTEALKILENFKISEDLTSTERYQFYFLKGSILVDLLDSEEALNYANLAYKESIKLKSDFQIVNSLILKDHILRSMLETNRCLEILNEAEDILAKNNQKSSKEYKLMKGYVLLRKGCHFFSTGDLNRGLSLLNESSDLANEINDIMLILQTVKWLAFTYSVKGESSNAFEYKKRYLKLAIKLNDKQELIGAHNTIGIELTEKGEIKKAIVHLEKSLTLCYEINSWKTFIVSTSLFDAYMKSNSIAKARQLHTRMGELLKQGTYRFNKEAYRLQEAALLKMTLHEDSLSKAEKIYKDVADKETTFIEFKIDALINLCDLYLIRLKITSNLKEMDKIQPYIKEIRSIAEKEGIYILLVELYSLQAKLMLVTFEFNKAKEYLSQALNCAHTHGLILLVRRIEKEQAELSRNYPKWE